MINPAPAIIKQRQYPAGFRQEITFESGSPDTVSLTIKSGATLAIYEIENVATWTISINGVAGVITNSTVRNYAVNTGDALVITITRTNPAAQSRFTIGAHVFAQSNTAMTLLNYSANLGGNSRYLYALKAGTTLLCYDTDLMVTSNLKSITAIVNNGTSLTITVASHGFSNGNTVSVLDVGGFSSDINHIPYTVSNATANTFDITVTVTGTWDSAGKLMGAWTTNPEIASITLPTVTGTAAPWTHLSYRSQDKSLYVFGTGQGGSAIAYACVVDTDDTSGGFNTTKNWDKSVSNASTNVGTVATSAPENVVYDSVRDRFIIVATGGTYWIATGTATPTRTVMSQMRTVPRATSFFAYGSQSAIFGTGAAAIYSYNPNISGVANLSGVLFNGFIYSQEYAAFWYKTNASGNFVKRTADDALTQVYSVSSGTSTWTGIGCAVDPLDRLYVLRGSGSFSYGVTHDCIVYDHVGNTREDVYITLPSSGATFMTKAVYGHDNDLVFAQDNGTSARIQIFDTNRTSGKKYIGYVAVGGTCQDIAMNNLFGL